LRLALAGTEIPRADDVVTLDAQAALPSGLMRQVMLPGDVGIRRGRLGRRP